LIDDYGWSEKLQRDFAPYAAQDFTPARVIAQHRGSYGLASDAGELTGQISGRLAHDAGEGGYPAVGDWVAIAARPAEGAATIHAVMLRRTAFVRKQAMSLASPQLVAANADVALLLASLNADFNARRLERYLALAWQSGAQPVVVLTKADLADDPEADVAEAESVAFGAPVLAVSVVTGEGLDAVAAYLKPRETAVLVGSSGVGKSTLVNALAGAELMETGAIREDDDRGRHTTTHRELLRLPSGALVLDTPGMRELGLFDASEGVSATFEDVEALVASCRFSDCQHRKEPGCAVREAIESGDLDPGRWKGWVKLQKEVRFQLLKESPEARQALRREWAPIQKAQRARRIAKRREGR
jgi:ribosome biogenesis GTPase